MQIKPTSTLRAVSAVVFSALLAGSALADRLELKDGSVLVGKLVSAEEGKVKFDTAFAGTIEVSQKEIKTFSTDEAVNVQLAGGSTVLGKVAASEAGVVVVANDGQFSAQTSNVSAVWQPGKDSPETRRLKEAADKQKRQWAYEAAVAITGRTGGSEKFAGALHTYCIEGLMQDGKALQAGTSHHLGQNFAKAFDVKFQDKDKELKYVFATSWGVSTRLIGAMVMTHSDDNGLVIPPKLAPLPVVIVPIYRNDEEMELVLNKAKEMTTGWDPLFFKIDNRDHYKPGFKFAEWELKGIPIRIEIGPRDVASGQVIAARRDTSEKITLPMEGLLEKLEALLDDIQANLFQIAKKRTEDNTHTIDTYEEYQARIGQGGFFRVFLDHKNPEVENRLQGDTKSTIRCIPFDAEPEEGECMITGAPCHYRVIASQSY